MDYASLKNRLDEESIEFVDFRVVDLHGRFRHVTVPASRLTPELCRDGIGFDGSNYGYRDVSGSDLVLIPDLDTAYEERQGEERLIVAIGAICDAETRTPSRIDPRGIARRATAALREHGIADSLQASPEFEFYVFDRVLYTSTPGRISAEVIPLEGRRHRDRSVGAGTIMTAYHAALPADELFALRNEMTRRLDLAGIPVKYHHHEVGSFGQSEIELGFGDAVDMADATLVVKSLVRTVAHEAGLTATFLPKPIFSEAGSGMHLHQYLVRSGENLFAGQDGLSDLALCYVGGLLTHGRSLMALTNPSTNSYRRLVPGYEAPVEFVLGADDRNAAVRVPAYARDRMRRIELRTMDATCNPYLAFAAILQAGLDGVRRGLNAHDLGFDCAGGSAKPEGPLHRQRIAPSGLGEALDALIEDHDYLLADGVFTESLIEEWNVAKREEIAAVAARPHPHEYVLYYDL